MHNFRVVNRRPRKKFATGKSAKGECQRCGFDYPYLNLKQEWTNLWVCEACYDPYPPQQIPVIISDVEALQHPCSSTYTPEYGEQFEFPLADFEKNDV